MKIKKIISILFIVFFLFTIKGQAQNCILKIYRPYKYVGSFIKARIFIDGKEVYQLPVKSKLTYSITKGKHTIAIGWKTTSPTNINKTLKEFDIQSNETIYFKVNAGGTSFPKQLQQISENIAISEFNLIPETNHSIKNTTDITDNIPPGIIITSPNITRGFKPVSENKQIAITGVVTDESGVYEVLINGEEINMQNNGAFSHTALLAMGDNSFTVTATDTKQNTTTKTFTIERNSNQEQTEVVNNQTNNNNVIQTGKYYALIIGVSEYSDPNINDLNNEPTNDAQELYNILTTNYTFDKENITLLKNPTYKKIVRSFDDFNKIVTDEDNFLIFYAGHGYYSEEEKVGYWLPSDAELAYTDAWLYNSVLVDNIKKINSKHTLLISDACFSGSIFQTRSLSKNAPMAYQKKYELKSRTGITSGTLKTVPNESIFFQYLIDRLKNNKQKYMSSSELFQKIEIPVGNNSPNTPQFGDIQNVGHEGGDFIFIRKD